MVAGSQKCGSRSRMAFLLGQYFWMLEPHWILQPEGKRESARRESDFVRPNPRTLEQLRGNIVASHAANVSWNPLLAQMRQMLTLCDSLPETAEHPHLLSRLPMNSKGVLPSYAVRGRPIDGVLSNSACNGWMSSRWMSRVLNTLLRGLRRTLRRFHPKVVMEWSLPNSRL